jgi:hypothetical protein
VEHLLGGNPKNNLADPKLERQLAEQFQLDQESGISHAYFDFLLQFKSQNWKITVSLETAQLSIGDIGQDEVSRIEALTREDVFMSLLTIPTYTEWAREVVRDFNLRAMRQRDRERRISLSVLINEHTAARVNAIDAHVAEMRAMWAPNATDIDLPRLNHAAFEVACLIYGDKRTPDLKQAFSIE